MSQVSYYHAAVLHGSVVLIIIITLVNRIVSGAQWIPEASCLAKGTIVAVSSVPEIGVSSGSLSARQLRP